MTLPDETHIMLDIEALGLVPGSAIFQLAAQAFNPSTGELGSSIDLLIRPEFPFTIDPETLQWHLDQGTYPLSLERNIDATNPVLALFYFEQWLRNVGTVEAWWAWGATYDFPLLAALFTANQKPTPWKYWQARCARTIFNTLLPSTKATPKPHNAAQDVVIQIHDLLTALSSEVLLPAANSDVRRIAMERNRMVSALKKISTAESSGDWEADLGCAQTIARIALD